MDVEPQKLIAAIKPEQGWLDVLDPQEQVGWQGLQFYLRSGGQTLVAGPAKQQAASDGKSFWQAPLTEGLLIRLNLAPSPGGTGWIATPVLQNHSKQEVTFEGYGWQIADGQPGPRHPALANGNPGLLVYGHLDNLRYERLPHCRIGYPFLRPLPPNVEPIGRPGCSPIPLLLLGAAHGRLWLAEGALTQQRHVLSWHVGLPTQRGQLLNYRSEYTWTGGASEIIPPGGEVVLETTFFCVFRAAPDGLYKLYMDELARAHQFSGPRSRLNHEPVYCTWNYFTKEFGIPTEAALLRRMDLVAEWQGEGVFQLDHGYQPLVNRPGPGFPDAFPNPDLDAFYPDPQAAWDWGRFPSGPKGFVAACRQRGLRPSLWWSPRVKCDGVLAAAHPHWLLRDREGRPIDVGNWYLDPSVSEVRAFLERCITTITADWGFEGIKLDFVTYMFDHADAVFANGGTNVTWKRWLLGTVRKALEPQGYFVHGVGSPMGDPFLAIDGCNAFGNGYDIGSGEWPFHVRNCAWALLAALAVGRATWFFHPDSCMGRPGIPEMERRSRCAFAYMTGGVLEFSGPVETLDQRAVEDYRLLSSRCDQGGNVFCPDESAFYSIPLPTILVRRHSADSRTRRRGISHTIGLFNWKDTEQATAVSLPQLGIDRQSTRLRDFWSGQATNVAGKLLALSLPPHGHALLDVLV